MTHNSRCANAGGPECVCSCNGQFHGIGSTGKPWHLPKGCRYLCKPMGGEVEQNIRQNLGKRFQCIKCGSTIQAKKFIGCSDPSGFSDKKGNKWRIYIECGKCGTKKYL